MLFLQNNEHFGRIGVLASAKSSKLEEHDRTILEGPPSAKTVGAYSHIGERLVGIFRLDGILYLLIDKLILPWHEIRLITLEDQPDNRRTFRVVACSEEIVVEYQRPVIDPPLSDIHEPFVEDEDYEFCLFVRNIAADPDRRERIFGT